jgi:protein-S-isoprenylcysteine O-methyltransferase Ste14
MTPCPAPASRPGGAATAGYAIVAYGAALAVLGYAIGFIAGAGTPTGIDRGPSVAWPAAVGIDFGLLALFAVQHTLMARPAVKRRLIRVLPAAAERSTFVLAASLALALLCWQWRPVGGDVWRTSGAGADVLLGCYAAGWLITVVATFMISHTDLFGLRQAFLRSRYTAPPFRQRGMYGLVRHPLMTGFVIVFWAAPVMTIGHLVLAAAATGYILIGIRFEEHDLRQALGPVYAAYCARVPALIPGVRPRSRPENTTLARAGSLR